MVWLYAPVDANPHTKSMIIPWQSMADETLEAMLEEIVTRDGTDYGDTEKSTAQKVTFVRNQLKAGYAAILWNAEIESASIVSAEQAEELENAVAQSAQPED